MIHHHKKIAGEERKMTQMVLDHDMVGIGTADRVNSP
jgi:hypothetical protein